MYFQKGFGRKTTFPKFLNGIRNQIKSVNYFDVSTDQRNIYLGGFHGMYSFCQLMTASMPTIICCNITAYRPTHDCFYTNLDHIMTAYLPTLGLTE